MTQFLKHDSGSATILVMGDSLRRKLSSPSPRRLIKAALLSIATLATGTAFAATTVVTLNGKATDPNSGQLLYTETHQQNYQDGNLTLHTVSYKNPDGNEIAIKTITYPAAPSTPVFEINDRRSGLQEGARFLSDGSYQLYARKSADSKIAADTIKLRDNTVVDAGFDRYVAANFDTLLAGESVPIRFALPSRQADYKFKVGKAERTTVFGRNAVQVTIRPASMLLGWLVDKIVLTYDIESRRLLRYEGVTNIQDDSGEPYKAQITYAPADNPGLFSASTPR